MTHAEASAPPAARLRLDWLDATKGVAILWIAYFHFFKAYTDDRLGAPFAPGWLGSFVSSCAPEGGTASLACGAKGTFVAFSLLGFHAVSVFLVLSGLGLGLSQAGRSASSGAPAEWGRWYRARLLRLYPMYWVAHAVVLVSPFAFQPEPVDGRLVFSLLGLRVLPTISGSFFYLNAAWWYFTLLLQLYLVFPLLWRGLERLGAPVFLAACAAATLASRWALLSALPVDGLWAQGGFFGARLFEFALGMALGRALRSDGDAVVRRLLSWPAVLAGAALYGLGLASYASLATYAATDALIGAGLTLLLVNAARALAGRARLGPAVCRVGAFSYGLYLVHQPYAIEAGIRLRGLEMAPAVLAFLPVLGLLTIASGALERAVNDLTNRWLPR